MAVGSKVCGRIWTGIYHGLSPPMALERTPEQVQNPKKQTMFQKDIPWSWQCQRVIACCTFHHPKGQGVISKTHSHFSSPTRPVQQSKGEWRLTGLSWPQWSHVTTECCHVGRAGTSIWTGIKGSQVVCPRVLQGTRALSVLHGMDCASCAQALVCTIRALIPDSRWRRKVPLQSHFVEPCTRGLVFGILSVL